MTFWLLCNHNDVLASVAVVTGLSVDQMRAPDGSRRCIDAIDAAWQPRVPILFMNGVLDPVLTPNLARARVGGRIERLALRGGDRIAGDGHFTRWRWTDTSERMTFDFIEHDYSAEGQLAGHCMPGGLKPTRTTCTDGAIRLNWGEIALQWFLDHPKP